MNEWPDELWANERSRMWATLDQFVSDVDEEIDDSAFIIESIAPWVVVGTFLIWFSCVATVLLGATAGWRRIRKTLRLRAIGSAPVVRHTS